MNFSFLVDMDLGASGFVFPLKTKGKLEAAEADVVEVSSNNRYVRVLSPSPFFIFGLL